MLTYHLVSILKVAVTDLAADIVTVQVAVPVQAPDQPAKVDPLLALAVRVTAVAGEKVAEQVAPQFTPAGALVTVPVPAPAFATDKE